MCRISGTFNADVTAAGLARVSELLRHGGSDAAFDERGPGWSLASAGWRSWTRWLAASRMTTTGLQQRRHHDAVAADVQRAEARAL